MSTGYHIVEQDRLHYVTLQVVEWVDIFSRQKYRDIIVENLNYCIKNKGLVINAWVIMSNHVHLLLRSETSNLSGTLRDFKSFTSKLILNEIESSNESRKDWMLGVFKKAAFEHKRNSDYQFWTHENHAEYIYSNKFVEQKLNYIHNNPVRAGLVQKPEDYIYSSAIDYSGEDGLIKLEIINVNWKTIK